MMEFMTQAMQTSLFAPSDTVFFLFFMLGAADPVIFPKQGNPMIKKSDKAVQGNSSVQRRKKIWQIESPYHCSIIGTCLNRADLRQLVRRKIFELETGSSDYRVHTTLAGVAKNRMQKTRALHKLLDIKYRLAIKRYSTLTEEKQILDQWKVDARNGAIPGAYWAIMTHPAVGRELTALVYGECHMASFDMFTDLRKENKAIKTLQQEVTRLEKMIVHERHQHRKEQETAHDEILLLKQSAIDKERSEQENATLKRSNHDLVEMLSDPPLLQEITGLTEQMQSLEHQNARLEGQVVDLTSEAAAYRKATESAEIMVARLSASLSELRLQNEEQRQEIVSLETTLLQKIMPNNECNKCKDLLTDKCKGPDLCGKTVLYVGGLHSMVPRYRKLVEHYGGNFMHHDGGKENSRNLLPKLLCGADIALCPVDCVSHDACKCLKKICKRYSKPFVMMRSSGLSSLAKGLKGITH